jgi:hypothetical protein
MTDRDQTDRNRIPATADRYLSFRNIDFETNMARVLGHLRRVVQDPARDNALWQRFFRRLAEAEGAETPMADQLLLLHAHVYYLAELFEEADDEEAIADLARLERECF